MLTPNQERVLRAFELTGILTLDELRKASPYWNQAIQVLVKRGLIKRENDGRYSVTPMGGATIADLQAAEVENQQA